ncbi:AAA family ATPase [Streptomyces sp. NPDC001941]|uniref:AAA family ATPase n=1 Tax=Streptomyces sp. NPDC001941 TaxID=3154659 RepID=UPI0033338FDF
MGTEDLDGIVRRRLVVVAVDGYADSPPGFDKGIARQVERITGWLADPALDDARRFEVHQAPPVRTPGELRDFLRREDLAAAGYQEAVVVYITGHGLRRVAPRHFLTFAGTTEERPFATAFPTSELITAVLDSESEHVLVLVDSCFAGTLDAELTVLLEALGKERRGHDGAAVVTAGDHDEQPLVGSFTERVVLACERMRDEAAGYTAPYLSFQEWEQLLDEVGRDEHGREKDLVDARWIVPRSRRRGPSACLPNPRFRPTTSPVGPALRELALLPAEDAAGHHDALRDGDALQGGDTLQGGDALRDMAVGSVDGFWSERASGRAAEDDAGWYFSGRATQMARLTAFLDDGEGALVVTGAAGSGKSALLARLVTLSDPGFATDPRYAGAVAGTPPALRPRPGAVDVAVLARNKSAGTVVRHLLDGLRQGPGEPSSPPVAELPLRALLRHVLERSRSGRPVTVVIDALDEAADPLAVLNDVVLPLARLRGPDGTRGARLLLGIRSSPVLAYPAADDLVDERADQLLLGLTTALGTEGLAAETLRSDGPDCAADIAAYAAALLLAPVASPYHDAPEAAAEAADVIAAAVAPSFLDARIAADQLRREEGRQDLAEEDWHERLADGTSGLLREDVRSVSRSTGVRAELLVAALRATAFAPGAGLPWGDVWPAVTAALAPGHVTADRADAADAAIRTLRGSRLTGYLATAEEDGRTVYRPVHQRLSDLLLADPDWLLAGSAVTSSYWWRPPSRTVALRTAHAAVTDALAALVERSLPHPVHPYVRRHFLHHADAGGVLEDRRVPLELLAQETSGTLRARLGLPLPTSDPERRLLTAAALIEPYVGHADELHADDASDRLARRGGIAFQRGARGEHWAAPGGVPAALDWGRWAARANVLAPTRGDTTGLCVLPTLDGRALVAVLSEDGTVRVWDSATGRLTAELPHGKHGRARGLAPIRATGGRTFLAVWGARGVTVLDPGSGQPITALDRRHVVDAHVLEDGASRWKLLVFTQAETLLWWPAAHGRGPGRTTKAMGFPHSTTRFRSSGTAVVRAASGHALVAVPTPEGIRLWDPFSGLTGHPPFGGENPRVDMAVPRPGQDDLLILRSLARPRIWDPFRARLVPHRPVRGRPLAVLPEGNALVGSLPGKIAVRDIGGQWDREFDADQPQVDRIAVLDTPRGPRIVSAGPQGVRLWDVEPAGGSHATGLPETLYAAPRLAPGWGMRIREWPLCRAAYPGTAGVVVVGTREGLDVHDAAAGRLLKRLAIRGVRTVEPVASPPGRALVLLETRHSWSVRDLVTEEVLLERDGPQVHVTTTVDGRPLVLGAEREPDFHRTREHAVDLAVWDPEASTRTTVPCPGPVKESLRLCVALPVDVGRGEEGDGKDGLGPIAVIGARTIRLLDPRTGEFVADLRRPPHFRTVLRLACALPLPGHTLLAVASSTDVHVWDTADGRLLTSWETHDCHVLAAVPLGDGRTLLASGDPGGVRFRDPLTGELRHSLITGAPVHGLATGITPTGTVLHVLGPAGLVTLRLDETLL